MAREIQQGKSGRRGLGGAGEVRGGGRNRDEKKGAPHPDAKKRERSNESDTTSGRRWNVALDDEEEE